LTATDTFTITINGIRNAGPPVIDVTTVTPSGITQILSADELSELSSATSPVLSGDFGVQQFQNPWMDGNAGIIHYDGGNVGIGTALPNHLLSVNGIIESISGGFKFPDGTIQSTTSTGDITGITAGIGLSGGGTVGDVTLNVDTSSIQNRVTGSCSVGSSIRTIDVNGAVTCETDDIGSNLWATSITGIYYSNTVSIGGASPQQKLHVYGNVIADNYFSPSSQKWKKDITPLDNTLDKITQIQGVTYQWRADEFPEMSFDETATQIGFIAEELEIIYPELVYTTDNGDKSIDYSKLTPILIEAIKEQQDILEQLKTVICPDNPELSACSKLNNFTQNTFSF